MNFKQVTAFHSQHNNIEKIHCEVVGQKRFCYGYYCLIAQHVG